MRRLLRFIVSTLLLFSICCFSLFDVRHVAARKASDEKNGEVVFCVTSTGPTKTFIEPLLIIDGGRYFNPIAGDSDASALKDFADVYYSAGKKYSLLFGGGRVGYVTVEKPTKDTECFRAGASVKLAVQGNFKLNRNVMALATDLKGVNRAQPSRRAPTPGERTEAIKLAKQAFKEKGLSPALLSTQEVVNLTAMDLDGDGKVEVIGTFVLKKIKGVAERHVLFVIAEPNGKSYRTALKDYGMFTTKDIMSGGSLDSIGQEGIFTERLVDALDLDNDNAAEVFTISNSFEGVTYKLYKKVSGTWKSIYEFNSYRCGF